MAGRSNSKALIVAFGVFTLSFGAGLWYSQTRAYYYDVTDVDSVTIGGETFAVSDYQGIDADTSPLKMRACFTIDRGFQPDDTYVSVAHPLIAPPQFACFDAAQLDADLASGAAVAVLAESNTSYGFDRYIAQYPDGRAYMWRQINACGEAVFAGDPAPEGCPPKPETE